MERTCHFEYAVIIIPLKSMNFIMVMRKSRINQMMMLWLIDIQKYSRYRIEGLSSQFTYKQSDWASFPPLALLQEAKS